MHLSANSTYVVSSNCNHSLEVGVHITRSCACVALACLWSSTATATTPATPQQMVCVPAVFVVATVTQESPSVSIPEHCKESHRFVCVFSWPLTLKIDRVIAARPSNFSPEMSGLQSGSILHVDVRVRASDHSKGVARRLARGPFKPVLVYRRASGPPAT